MARTEIVIGANALSASLASGTGLVQMDEVGGFQTFVSSSYHTGRSKFGAFGGFIRPNSDISTVEWGPTTLFSQISESVPDAGTSEITSSAINTVTPSTTASVFEVGLTSPSVVPDNTEVVTVRVNVAKSGSFAVNTGSAGDNTASVEVFVVSASLDIASGSFVDIGTGFTSLEFILTKAERFAVFNWNDVSVRTEFSMSVATASSAVEGRCTQLEIEFARAGFSEAPPVDNRVFRLIWES